MQFTSRQHDDFNCCDEILVKSSAWYPVRHCTPAAKHILTSHGASGPTGSSTSGGFALDEVARQAHHRFFGTAARRQGLHECAMRTMDGWRVIFSSRETLRRLDKIRAPSKCCPRRALANLLEVFFPSCFLLNAGLSHSSRYISEFLCRECFRAIEPARAPQCVVCGDRLVSASY